MTRLSCGFHKFNEIKYRSEIIEEHCPVEVDASFPDMDIDTYKFQDEISYVERGCRGITCEECWDAKVEK